MLRLICDGAHEMAENEPAEVRADFRLFVADEDPSDLCGSCLWRKLDDLLLRTRPMPGVHIWAASQAMSDPDVYDFAPVSADRRH